MQIAYAASYRVGDAASANGNVLWQVSFSRVGHGNANETHIEDVETSKIPLNFILSRSKILLNN